MFLKLIICVFSILVFVKNISYSMYEYQNNKNIIGAISVTLFSLVAVIVLNVVLFFIKV